MEEGVPPLVGEAAVDAALIELEYWLAVRERQPYDDMATRHLSSMTTSWGWCPQVVSALRRWVARCPDSYAANQALTQALWYGSGTHAEVRSPFEAWIKRDPDSPWAHFGLAHVHNMLSDRFCAFSLRRQAAEMAWSKVQSAVDALRTVLFDAILIADPQDGRTAKAAAELVASLGQEVGRSDEEEVRRQLILYKVFNQLQVSPAAAKAAERLAELRPNDPDSWGRVAEAMAPIDKAKERSAWTREMELRQSQAEAKPYFLENLQAFAIVQRQLSSPNETLETWRGIGRRWPDDYYVLYNCAMSLQNTEDGAVWMTQALEAVANSLAGPHPSRRAATLLGTSFGTYNNHSALHLAQAAFPDESFVFDALAYCHFKNGDCQDEVAIRRRQVSLYPNNPHAHKQFIRALSRLGDGEALHAARKALDELQLRFAATGFSAGGDESEEAAHLLAQTSPHLARLWFDLAKKQRTTSPRDAEAAFSRGVKLAEEFLQAMPEATQMLSLLREAYADWGRLDEAVEVARKLCATAPANDGHWGMLVNLLIRSGRQEEAEWARSRRTITIGMASNSNLSVQVSTLIEAGRYEDARSLANARQRPDLPSGQFSPDQIHDMRETFRQRAIVFENLEQPGDAIRAYEEFLTHFPNDSDILYQLGNALDRAGRSHEAEQIYRRAVEHSPTPMISLLHRLGRHDEAIAAAEEQFRKAPDEPHRYATLARSLQRGGKTGRALELFRKAAERMVAERPAGDAQSLCLAGDWFQNAGETKEAERCYRSALAANPLWSDACIKVADIEQTRNDFVSAFRVIDTALIRGCSNNPGLMTRYTFLIEQLPIGDRFAPIIEDLRFLLMERHVGITLNDRIQRADNIIKHAIRYMKPAWRKDAALALNSIDEMPYITFLRNELIEWMDANLEYYEEFGRSHCHLRKAENVLSHLMQNLPDHHHMMPTIIGRYVDAMLLHLRIEDAPEELAPLFEALSFIIDRGYEHVVRGSLASLLALADGMLTRKEWHVAAELFDRIDELGFRLRRSLADWDTRQAWVKAVDVVGTHAAYAWMKASPANAGRAALALERSLVTLISDATAINVLDPGQLDRRQAQLVSEYRSASAEWQGLTQVEKVNSSEISAARKRVEQAIAAIRTEGYPDFLRRPELADILTVTARKPIVYIVALDRGAFALVARGENFFAIELSGLRQEDLKAKLREYLFVYEQMLAAMDRRGRIVEGSPGWEGRLQVTDIAINAFPSCLDDFGRWLHQFVFASLSSRLRAEGIFEFTLIPTGQLAMAPLTVAWRPAPPPTLRTPIAWISHWLSRMADPDGRYVKRRKYLVDEFSISIAPSARSVAGAPVNGAEEGARFLGVHTPSNSHPYLASCAGETNAIAAMFPDQNRVVLSGKDADKDSVLRELGAATIFHFSWHGQTDLRTPLLKNGLHLADGQFLSVGDILAHRIEVSLVTLAACEVGLRGAEVPDEAISLPTALIHAGAAGVISAQWAVHSERTADLMREFYRIRQTMPDQPARALALAQREFRQKRPTKEMAVDATLRRRVTNQTLPPSPLDRLAHDHPFCWGAFFYMGR